MESVPKKLLKKIKKLRTFLIENLLTLTTQKVIGINLLQEDSDRIPDLLLTGISMYQNEATQKLKSKRSNF